jgi:formylglycine-generating enzyme required for sulfatase activity
MAFLPFEHIREGPRFSGAERRSRHVALMAPVLAALLPAIGWPSRPGEGNAARPADVGRPYVERIPGTDFGIEMLPIPAGEFLMGSPPDEPGRNEDEGPQHRVALRAFWMSKTEITWDAYDRFRMDLKLKQQAGLDLESQPAHEKQADAVTRPTPPYTDETFGFGRSGQPVINITQHAAMEFTRWLSAKTGKVYRLPTEAEWEYACRAGSATAYHFGEESAELDDYAWFRENSSRRPHSVGLKQPNAWGLHDMHGNVAEWVLDRYDGEAYKQFTSRERALSPVLVPGREKFPHVVRGGSWREDATRLRCAARRASTEDWLMQDPQRPSSIWWLTEALHVGFRIVRPVEEQEELKGLRSLRKKYDY